jgi:hypothetical protein
MSSHFDCKGVPKAELFQPCCVNLSQKWSFTPAISLKKAIIDSVPETIDRSRLVADSCGGRSAVVAAMMRIVLWHPLDHLFE